MEKVPRATNRVHTLTSVDHHHSTTWVEAEREGEGLATGPRVVKVSHARRRPATVIARRGCGSAGLRNLRRRLVVVVAPDATAVVHRHPVAPRRPPLWPWLGRTGAHGAAAPAQGAPRATGERGGRHQHLLQEGAVRFRAHVKLHFVRQRVGALYWRLFYCSGGVQRQRGLALYASASAAAPGPSSAPPPAAMAAASAPAFPI